MLAACRNCPGVRFVNEFIMAGNVAQLRRKSNLNLGIVAGNLPSKINGTRLVAYCRMLVGMHHVNSRAGLTLDVSEAKSIGRIAQRSILSAMFCLGTSHAPLDAAKRESAGTSLPRVLCSCRDWPAGAAAGGLWGAGGRELSRSAEAAP